jgi:hypothetical protein
LLPAPPCPLLQNTLIWSTKFDFSIGRKVRNAMDKVLTRKDRKNVLILCNQ